MIENAYFPISVRLGQIFYCDNVLSIEAASAYGLAGLLVRLDRGESFDSPLLITDEHWQWFDTAPYGWPFRAEVDGKAPHVLADIERSPYRADMDDWPALVDHTLDMAGTPKPAEGIFSAPVSVTVTARALKRPPSQEGRRVGIQFEPWFTPHNANWSSAQAVPLTGRYWSWNRDVQRQQLIWLMESGIDFLVVDWTNHLWGKAHWAERPDSTNEIIHATTVLLETLAVLRDEGHEAPKIVLYLGLNNGPETTVGAVEEAMAWIHSTYIRNPRFNGLFEPYLGRPLLLVHNGGGPAWRDQDGRAIPESGHFTIRYQSYHHEFNDHGEAGYWSWMDATPAGVPTLRDGVAEALTVSVACFGSKGWRDASAYPRRGGHTLMEGFRSALAHRPLFLQVHQYQEFAGQWEGFGYGPNRDIYVDSYSVERSDDVEPVSRTARAYRGEGGWGFYYLNLLRALVDCYQQAKPETTVLVLSQPLDGASLSGPTVDIAWQWLGKAPESIELRVNGQRVEHDPESLVHTLDITAYPSGPLNISVTGIGTQSRYTLSHTEASAPLEPMAPARASVECQLVRE